MRGRPTQFGRGICKVCKSQNACKKSVGNNARKQAESGKIVRLEEGDVKVGGGNGVASSLCGNGAGPWQFHQPT